MARDNELTAPLTAPVRPAETASWAFSLPMVVALYVYAHFLSRGSEMLMDGDTYSHIGIGRWILEHGAVPRQDYFSHTMPGTPWVAFEWLSQVVLALTHQAGGWTAVVAVTSLAVAVTMGMLARALMRHLEPIYVLLFVALAVATTAGHVLARPHVLAMPVLMAWTVELVRAADEGRTPRRWMLPLMALWSNAHGGFVLGLALTVAFGAEAVLAAPDRTRRLQAARAWGGFFLMALVASMLTPHGPHGLLVTWQTLMQDQYALSRISEWRSPDFHSLQALEVWILGALALAFHQGLRLPLVRLALLLGLIHLALKHLRYAELLGQLAPLFVAAPLAAQWRHRRTSGAQFDLADRWLAKLSRPAGTSALALSVVVMAAVPLWMARSVPVVLPEKTVPAAALDAAHKAGLKGRVLNGYEWGGYLLFSGVPVFIDGRSDLYRDTFIKDYVQAMDVTGPGHLEKLLARYDVAWTMLSPERSAVALLDRLPGWRRVYTDATAVVHARVDKQPADANSSAKRAQEPAPAAAQAGGVQP